MSTSAQNFLRQSTRLLFRRWNDGADSPVPIMTKFHHASGNWFINGTAMTALVARRRMVAKK